jgi:hydrogenase 3 maturation protease
MLYLLAFGNPYLNQDNLALSIADAIITDKIKGLEVVKCISPEEVLNYTDKEFFILDVVKDAKEIIMIDDIDKLRSSNMVTLHDFDLGFFLKLMKETGQIEKVKIIGIPQQGDITQIKQKVISMLPIGKETEKANTSPKTGNNDCLLLGVGNTLRADDGIGCYIADRFSSKHPTGWQVINAGPVPENFTSVIRKAAPKTVVILDSAEMKLPPGTYRIIPKEKIGTLHLTTHAMPLSVLIEFIEEFVPKVIFIGIQPKEIKTDITISPELEKAAEELIGILKNKEFNNLKTLP